MINLRLKFSGALNWSTATNPAYYQLSLIKKAPTRKAPVRYLSAGLLSSPTYDASTDTVTLIPPKALKSGTYRLLVISSSSSGVLDASERPLARGNEALTLTV